MTKRIIIKSNDWNPALHPRDDEGKFTEVSGALNTVTTAFKKVQNDELRDAQARRQMERAAKEETGVDVSLRTLPDETEKAARATQELIKLSDSEDLSGLDEFRLDSTDDDLKGLQAKASGRYKIRDRKIVINPEQFTEETISEWREEGHTIQTEPESIIKHEVGHYLHGQNTAPIDQDSDVSWNDIDGDFSEADTDRIQDVLGEYGATMPGEFVAEAYTYQKEGNELPDDLQELYERWNGPQVE